MNCLIPKQTVIDVINGIKFEINEDCLDKIEKRDIAYIVIQDVVNEILTYISKIPCVENNNIIDTEAKEIE